MRCFTQSTSSMLKLLKSCLITRRAFMLRVSLGPGSLCQRRRLCSAATPRPWSWPRTPTTTRSSRFCWTEEPHCPVLIIIGVVVMSVQVSVRSEVIILLFVWETKASSIIHCLHWYWYYARIMLCAQLLVQLMTNERLMSTGGYSETNLDFFLKFI